METFSGKLAVVTGGGSGMGRELVLLLAAEGCSVATCDFYRESAQETAAIPQKEAMPGVRITIHACDVSDESQVLAFGTEVIDQHQTDHVELLLDNAGVGGQGSFVADHRESWERTFARRWLRRRPGQVNSRLPHPSRRRHLHVARGNWAQTVTDRGWFVVSRLNTAAFFARFWRPGGLIKTRKC